LLHEKAGQMTGCEKGRENGSDLPSPLFLYMFEEFFLISDE